MNKPIIITGLDIGSSKISAAALEVMQGSAQSTALAYESQPSKGLSRGVITDLAEASNSVGRVLARLGERMGRRADNIYANISGENVKGEKSRGMIPLSSRGREVTKSDIDRCINAASTIRLAFDREVIHRIVLNFSIDDQPAIKNALGLYASRLSCEMYMITANINNIQNIYKCADNAGYDIKALIYTGIAEGTSLLEDGWKEEGVILLNMGSSITEVSIFFGGSLGSLDIIMFGACDIKGALKENAEFAAMTTQVKDRGEDFIKKGGNIRSVVITGGLAFSEGVAEILEERLSYPVRMGMVKNVQGSISSIEALRAATVI
ncbi:MAG: hypothetical protein HZA72_00185, partial [Candidatus Omnitrophica bacterium]|nr:hypothetical protein [Candidatus Omnitrophota bacterium]